MLLILVFLACVLTIWCFFRGREKYKSNTVSLLLKVSVAVTCWATQIMVLYSDNTQVDFTGVTPEKIKAYMESWTVLLQVHLVYFVISYLAAFTFFIIFMRLSLVEKASEVTSYNLMKCYGRSEREKEAELCFKEEDS